jgi:hypothetical protein
VTILFTKGKHLFIHKLGYHRKGYIKDYILFVHVVEMETTYQKQKGHENVVLIPWVTSEVAAYQDTC